MAKEEINKQLFKVITVTIVGTVGVLLVPLIFHLVL